MGLINIGIASITFGAIAPDGGMSTTLTALGFTLEGTAKINTEDPQLQEFYAEEVDSPIEVDETKGGKMTVQLTIADPDEQTLKNVFGGTVTGTGATAKYSPPNTSVTIEQSIKITPKKGLGFDIPRARVTAKFTPDIGRGKLLGVEITGTVLQPTKVGLGKYETFRV